jgi:hypothetical protein
MVAEYYVVDGAGMDAQGITITAKDPLAFCDAKKSQAPVLSTGRLADDYDASTTAMALSPTGIGDAEYPASGYLCLGGKEIVEFTRSADALTVVRAQHGTAAKSHDEGASAQLCLVYTAQNPATICHDLLTNYTEGFDPSWADLTAWQTEATSYIDHLYTAIIPVPTEVKALLNELVEQAGLSIWWDVEAQAVQFQSLRPVAPDATLYDDDIVDAGSLGVKEQLDKRVSQVWTWFGIQDPTDKNGKEDNYQNAAVRFSDTRELEYTLPAIRKITSRWMSANNRAAAERLNDMLIARYTDPPRKASFSMLSTVDPKPLLGKGIRLGGKVFQGPTGAEEPINAYVISVEPGPEHWGFQVEEMNFIDLAADNVRTIYIDVDQFNVDLAELYASLYGPAPSNLVLHVRISSGVYIGSVDTALPAFDAGGDGDWPGLAEIHVHVAAGAAIMGAGGKGAGYGADTAEAGGVALKARRTIYLHNAGTVGGGGGGGGRLVESTYSLQFAGGGGGSGYNRREAGVRYGGRGGLADGTDGRAAHIGRGEGGAIFTEAGSARAGDGGLLGSAGQRPNAPYGSTATDGGAGGPAIDGASFTTVDGAGQVYGTQVN